MTPFITFKLIKNAFKPFYFNKFRNLSKSQKSKWKRYCLPPKGTRWSKGKTIAIFGRAIISSCFEKYCYLLAGKISYFLWDLNFPPKSE
jgi:hypothetical protein